MSIRQNPSARINGRPRVAIGAVTIAVATLAISASSYASDGSVESGTVEPTVPITAPPANATVTTDPATPVAAERELAIGQFSGAGDTRVSYAVPPGWEPVLDEEDPVHGLLVRGPGDPNVAVRFLEVANIFADPCQWTRFDPPVGPTVDDLVSAVQQVPAFDVTAPRDVTVDGYDGKYLEITFDPYDEAECRRFVFWEDTGGGHWWAQGPEQTTRVWILDVAGTRLVIEGFYHPTTPGDPRAAIDEIIDSIQIG